MGKGIPMLTCKHKKAKQKTQNPSLVLMSHVSC